MAAKRKLSSQETEPPVLSTSELLRRVLNVLALTLVKGQQQTDQISALNSVGFTPSEIAALLDSTPGTVSQTLYVKRLEKKRKPKSKKSPSGKS